MEVEDDRLVDGEQAIEVPVRGRAVSLSDMSLYRSTTFTKRILSVGKCSRSSATAASASLVGMSPAQAITTSGSVPASLLTGGQMLMPLVQWMMACSMVMYCKCDCLSETITLM